MAELVLHRVTPGAHENPEIGRCFFAEQIFTGGIGFAVHASEEQIASLGKRGDERGLIDTTVFLRSEQHAGVARVQREGEHFAANRSDC